MNPQSLIKNTNGKFFSVDFIKKNGDLRHMTARTGVSKGVKGTGLSFNPTDHGLVVAWDTTKKQFRMINLATLLSFQCGKVQWKKAA